LPFRAGVRRGLEVCVGCGQNLMDAGTALNSTQAEFSKLTTGQGQHLSAFRRDGWLSPAWPRSSMPLRERRSLLPRRSRAAEIPVTCDLDGAPPSHYLVGCLPRRLPAFCPSKGGPITGDLSACVRWLRENSIRKPNLRLRLRLGDAAIATFFVSAGSPVRAGGLRLAGSASAASTVSVAQVWNSVNGAAL
jgi:hypothetical protein